MAHLVIKFEGLALALLPVRHAAVVRQIIREEIGLQRSLNRPIQAFLKHDWFVRQKINRLDQNLYCHAHLSEEIMRNPEKPCPRLSLRVLWFAWVY